MATLSASDQQLEAKRELDLVSQHPEVLTVPPVLLELLQGAPTAMGEILVEQLLANGRAGAARLPRSSTTPDHPASRVLEPDKFPRRRRRAAGDPPPDPDGGATAENRGVLGAFLLQKALEMNGGDASSTVAYWCGDAYVTWIDGTRSCIKDAMVGDDAVATPAHLGEALAAWARATGATVEQDDSGRASSSPPAPADQDRLQLRDDRRRRSA